MESIQFKRMVSSAYALVFLIGTSTCLKKVTINVPTLVDLRSPVNLTCQYEVGENNKIYSVKWYKDDTEIFRYAPSLKPSQMIFREGSLYFNVNKTDCDGASCTLVLTNLLQKASGVYTCEVSTEAPIFMTDMQSVNMTVLGLPMHDPEIIGMKEAYSIGDFFDATCKTAASLPAAEVFVFLNDRMVDEANLIRIVFPSDKLFITEVQIRLNLTNDHFEDETKIQLSCSSSLGPSAPIPDKVSVATATLNDSRIQNNEKLEWSNNSSSDRIRVVNRNAFVSIVLCAWIVRNARRNCS